MKNRQQKLPAAFASIPLKKIACHIPIVTTMVCMGIITSSYFASGMRAYTTDLYDFIISDSTGFLKVIDLMGYLSWFPAALMVMIDFFGKKYKRAIPGLCCAIVSFWFFFILLEPYLD